jgi:uncharacterized membrane protein
MVVVIVILLIVALYGIIKLKQMEIIYERRERNTKDLLRENFS